MRPGRLEGRTCLIVGGTGGIGLAAARRFLEEGARVLIAGRPPIDPEPPAVAIEVDVADPESVARLFEAAREHLGDRLDVLFHVAGISGRSFGDGPLDECTDEGWDRVMEVNARGVFLTNRTAVRRMRTQSIDDAGLRGTVLNVGSVLSASPAPTFFGTIAYAASKGAVRALTIAAAARFAPERIRFNLLEPALIDTPMATRAVGDPTIRAYLATKQPMASGPGTADDCAEAALYLCEPASRFVTGTVLNVDGGWSVSEGQHESSPG